MKDSALSSGVKWTLSSKRGNTLTSTKALTLSGEPVRKRKITYPSI
jgi:hypothetical protein